MKLPRTFLALLVAGVVPGYGQLTVAIDLDPSTVGIQSVRSANASDIFTAEIVLTVGASGLSSYGISLLFDNSELSLSGSPATMEFLPSGFTFNFTAGVAEESDTTTGMPGFGHVYTYEAATFGTGPSSTTFSIGNVTFSVSSALYDGMVDVTPGFFNSGVDGAFDNAGNPITPTFVSASIIPEPSSLALIALTLLGTGYYCGWIKKAGERR